MWIECGCHSNYVRYIDCVVITNRISVSLYLVYCTIIADVFMLLLNALSLVISAF